MALPTLRAYRSPYYQTLSFRYYKFIGNVVFENLNFFVQRQQNILKTSKEETENSLARDVPKKGRRQVVKLIPNPNVD